MNKKKPRAPRPRRIELDARLTIQGAVELHRTLMDQLARGGPIVVDGTRVEEIDTAILQLLASLWRTSAERGVACAWHGASATLRKTATLIGVAPVLCFPSHESADPL